MNDNRSVQRCLAILRYFRAGPNQSLMAISNSVGLPHSTVLRFLNTLENEGYVRKDGGLWSLTPQMLEIGFAALDNAGVNQTIQASLQALADEFSGYVNIGEKNRDEVAIIARAEAESERRKLMVVTLRAGNSLPRTGALYCALDLDDDKWAIVRHPDFRIITVGIPIFSGPTRSLSLGLSVDIDAYPVARIESEVVPRMRVERDQIKRLMHLGQI